MSCKQELFSPCGHRCWECRSYPAQCAGCRPLKGEVEWTQYVDAVICPIYTCCMYEKKLENCGQCPELPCAHHTEMRSSEQTLEEHLELVRERMHVLREYNTSGMC